MNNLTRNEEPDTTFN